MAELNKRIITSFFLLFSLYLSIINSYILTLILLIVYLQTFYEIFSILKNIYKKKILIYILVFCSNIYIFSLILYIWTILSFNFDEERRYLFIYITISISSDIGGYIFGNIFKGKKLTKISPKKTYSGMIGSYLFSISVTYLLFNNFISIKSLLLLCLIISTITQLGDLFISLLKRKAKIKDTGKILPGHGGLLDRFDGIIFAIPFGAFITKIL